MSVHIRRWFNDEVLTAAQKLKPLADEAGLTQAQFAIAWALRRPEVSSAIMGASRPEQVEANVAAAGRRVDPVLFARAEALLEAALARVPAEA